MSLIDPTQTSISDLRRDYRQQALLETEVNANPILQFQSWFEQAVQAELPEPNAMTLATISADSQPSARMVLLKGVDQQGSFLYQLSQSERARFSPKTLGCFSLLVGRIGTSGPN